MRRIGQRSGLLLVLGLFCILVRTEAGPDYKISPEDILVIQVVGEKDLPTEFRVSGSGTIDFPFLKQVEVAGKTPAEVKQKITELLDKDYLVDPQVTVDVKQYRVREVLVNGQVNRPGAIRLGGEEKLTILAAIGRAGGLSPRANTKKIRLIRPGQFERVFTLNALTKESDPEKIPILEPGDIIQVQDKLF
jgi:polysaccharide biosynthesis/export protein VpsN